jgi:hypothetical protein
MAVYLTISVGARPQDARPVLASADSQVVGAALRAVVARVGGAAMLEGTEASDDAPLGGEHVPEVAL